MAIMAKSDGSDLSKASIDELKAAFKGEIVVKGETDEERYKMLIDRWNKIHIAEAV